jgi:hypothetical protein
MDGAEVRPPAPHGASPDGPVGGATGPFDFVPPDFDWKGATLDTVRKYPVSCLVGAAVVGFYIGRHRGKVITAAVVGAATNLVLRQLNQVFDHSDF